MNLSSNQLNQIATALESISGDPRNYDENNILRISTALQKLANTADYGSSFPQQITQAVQDISNNWNSIAPSPKLNSLYVNNAGVYNASDYGLDGFNSVNADIPSPTLGTLVANENGTYNASDYGVYGYSSVQVAVQGGYPGVNKTIWIGAENNQIVIKGLRGA